jgi:serine O-acetyltransferase
MRASPVIRADLLRFIDPAVPHADARWDRPALRAALRNQGLWAVVEYRFRRAIPTFPRVVRIPLRVASFFSRLAIETMCGISIETEAEFGPGLYIGHFGGIVVGGEVKVGADCNLSQGVTLGSYNGSPVIGDRVYLAPGCKVFGPVTLGDDVWVGANAVVNRDVPAGTTVVSPAELKPRGSPGS